MFEIAGLAISGLNLALNLLKTAKDFRSWAECDIEVDNDWLELAFGKTILTGPLSDYEWLNERHVPSAELRDTHSPIIAYNTDRKIRYRLFQGISNTIGGRLMLVKKINSLPSATA